MCLEVEIVVDTHRWCILWNYRKTVRRDKPLGVYLIVALSVGSSPFVSWLHFRNVLQIVSATEILLVHVSPRSECFPRVFLNERIFPSGEPIMNPYKASLKPRLAFDLLTR